MARQDYAYVIVGGGLAGASAIEGIREMEKNGSILLISSEEHLPYHRPPLSKKLWTGKKRLEDIFFKGQDFYDGQGVTLKLSTTVTDIDPVGKRLIARDGQTFGFGKLLLATGGEPKRLDIPGGDMEGVCYYRYLDDFLATRSEAAEGKSAVVIGGGFIGSEMAAALNMNHVNVTMIYSNAGLCGHVFPAALSRSLEEQYRQRGITVLSPDRPTEISHLEFVEGPALSSSKGRFLTRTQSGRQIESDIVIVGIGIEPQTELAKAAGLSCGNGIVVDEYLQTSRPDIFAAGDNARFPYAALDTPLRIEHWDNALSQGHQAGRNMAGAHEPFLYMPYFYSDLFEFGYEAVGEVDSRLESFADWQKENDTGIIYYTREGVIRGAMMCNVWKKLEEAREMIRRRQRADSLLSHK